MEGLLCSGYMFPWKHDGNVIWEGTMYQAAQPEYLTLSKTIREKYGIRMQTENTYAIGFEDLGTNMDWVQFLPPVKDRPYVRKAHIHFDLGELDPDNGGYHRRNPDSGRCSGGVNCIWCDDRACYKDGLWMKKNKYIQTLELEELTLDLRDCYKTWKRDRYNVMTRYSDHWEWDGVAVARCRRYFRLQKGLPSELHILTKNVDEEQKVIQAIQDKNWHRLKNGGEGS
ncbi:MAG: hypothetical protein Q9199_007234 [Rusavskia elegans]